MREFEDGRRFLAFTISSGWGHFRQVGSAQAHYTYSVPPRTTVAGMIAAICGAEPDTYYDVLAPDNADICVVRNSPIQKQMMGITTVKSQKSVTEKVNSRSHTTPTLNIPDPLNNRQRHTFELLHEPSYTVYVAIDDNSMYDTLRDNLSSGRPHYTPSMGLSEFVSRIEYRGEFDATVTETTNVDSVNPYDDSVDMFESGSITIERFPRDMEQTDFGRKTTEFDQYVIGDDVILADEMSAYLIDGDVVAPM